MDDLITAVLLFVIAFLPPVIYAIWIRNVEVLNRESWKPIFACFLWGATIAVIASLILEVILSIPLTISISDANIFAIISAVIIAPFVEELTKPIVLRFKVVKKELDEVEDGLIYGAIAGLGFSATENLLYGTMFLSYGFFAFLIGMMLRSFGGCLLHASATAWTGYGFGKSVMRKSTILRVVPYFILAIGLHALYNLAASLNTIEGYGIGLVIAMIFAGASIFVVIKKIKTLDSAK